MQTNQVLEVESNKIPLLRLRQKLLHIIQEQDGILKSNTRHPMAGKEKVVIRRVLQCVLRRVLRYSCVGKLQQNISDWLSEGASGIGRGVLL